MKTSMTDLRNCLLAKYEATEQNHDIDKKVKKAMLASYSEILCCIEYELDKLSAHNNASYHFTNG